MPILKEHRQELYVQKLVEGLSQRQAYYAAYPDSVNWKPESVDSRASRILKIPEVRDRYRELMDEAAMRSVMTRAERMATLSNMAGDDRLGVKTRVSAIAELNKMDGAYEHKKIDLTVNTDVGEVASKVEAILDE